MSSSLSVTLSFRCFLYLYSADIIYSRQTGYIVPGVCLSVCLFVSNFTQKLKIRIFMKMLPEMHLWTRKNRWNLGINNPPPDPHPGIFKDSLAFRDSAFFHTLAYISKIDRIFMKMLLRMHLWIKKSPLFCGSDPYIRTDSRSRPDQWRRQRSKGHFEVTISSSQVTQMNFFPQLKLTTSLVGRQSCKIKQIKRSAVRYGKIFIFCLHYYRSNEKQ